MGFSGGSIARGGGASSAQLQALEQQLVQLRQSVNEQGAVNDQQRQELVEQADATTQALAALEATQEAQTDLVERVSDVEESAGASALRVSKFIRQSQFTIPSLYRQLVRLTPSSDPDGLFQNDKLALPQNTRFLALAQIRSIAETPVFLQLSMYIQRTQTGFSAPVVDSVQLDSLANQEFTLSGVFEVSDFPAFDGPRPSEIQLYNRSSQDITIGNLNFWLIQL